MDIPRTYLADVARAALAKIGKAEPHPLDVEQAIVELQSVQNLIARGAIDLIDTDFERACQEALAEIPLNEWLAKWRQAQKAEQAAASAAAAEAEEAAAASRAEHVARAEAEAAEATAKAEAEAAEAAVKAEAEKQASAESSTNENPDGATAEAPKPEESQSSATDGGAAPSRRSRKRQGQTPA
jgi:hypothetical protein